MAEGARDEVRYTAFLSYSHRDAAAAGKLHRRLESYRLPRRLVGKETPRGIVPQRLWPIFRDRDELPAASDLSETVRTALAQSGALIILCSAHAAESLWVAEEIRVFRELHPDRPILAAILDGDPPACFPEALRAFGQDGTWHEPLATDLRPQADGPHLGLLKLVAGITGVGLDELVQRDAARRIRRVMAVTGAALVAMLIMAALAVVALNARAEAERQRAEAEGLIEFMLTDLRTKLKGVGRLEIMQAVNARALRYYDAQPQLNRLPVDSLLRRARSLRAAGEVSASLSDFDAALAAFRDAHRTTAEQLARDPDDLRRVLEHARSEYWIGRVYEARREWPLAQAQYVRAAAAAERLIAAEPDNPDYMMLVGSTATDLGNIQLTGSRDAAAAQRFYEKAVQWYGRAVQARPRSVEALRAHANAYANLADTFFAREQWRRSLESRLRQYRIVERLHRADPANMEDVHRLALAERGVAASRAKVGDRRGAGSDMVRAYDRVGDLTRHDPRNSEWLLLRAMVGCELLYRGVDFEDRVPRARVIDDVGVIARELDRQNDPDVARLRNCRNAIRSETGNAEAGEVR